MKTDKLSRLLHSIQPSGIYSSPLSLLITDLGNLDNPKIVALLYIKEAIGDNSIDALLQYTIPYVSKCDWYPLVASDTIEGALLGMEKRVNQIKDDKKSMENWFLDLFHAQFNLTKHYEDGTESTIDLKVLKLTSRPDYCV